MKKANEIAKLALTLLMGINTGLHIARQMRAYANETAADASWTSALAKARRNPERN